MLELSPAERRALRARAHHLHPVVSVGQHGLTASVVHEIDVALAAHELIKVRVHDDDRDARERVLANVCETLAAAPVQHLGKLLIVYRPKPPSEAKEAPARRVTANARKRTGRRESSQRPVVPAPDATRPRRRTTVAASAPRGARNEPTARRRRKNP